MKATKHPLMRSSGPSTNALGDPKNTEAIWILVHPQGDLPSASWKEQCVDYQTDNMWTALAGVLLDVCVETHSFHAIASDANALRDPNTVQWSLKARPLVSQVMMHTASMRGESTQTLSPTPCSKFRLHSAPAELHGLHASLPTHGLHIDLDVDALEHITRSARWPPDPRPTCRNPCALWTAP